jgi:phospholipid/cholesterol/gamma-HCH transport system substrate-binding protein
MITRKTKIQLMVFALITMVGVAYVGATYARLDRLVFDDSYRVVAHFDDSGGIFAGAGVSYRGVSVGQVSALEVTDDGVDVILDIDDDSEPIPLDTDAMVANRSAVGEQYVDLLPNTKQGPHLGEDSEIEEAKTHTPIPPTKLLVDLDKMVSSVDKDSLRTVVSEMGKAFQGTGEDMGQIIDTSNSFIETANQNFDVTTALIKDSNTVLQTQLDSASNIKSFARDLALFSDTMVGSDTDLRRVIENGSATANELRRFLEDNKVDLGQLINNLVTTGEVTVKHLDGVEQVLVIYPYVVEGGYTVVAKDPKTGLYDAHFGLILQTEPHVCTEGYDPGQVRSPEEGDNAPMDMDARCTEPQSQSNARGAQHAPRAGAAYRSPVVAAYDPGAGTIQYTDASPSDSISYTGGAASVFGEESWKWLLLQPLASEQE